ncbi:hypothetical protein B7463_g12774, partial [Scytalidium lignicola]
AHHPPALPPSSLDQSGGPNSHPQYSQAVSGAVGQFHISTGQASSIPAVYSPPRATGGLAAWHGGSQGGSNIGQNPSQFEIPFDNHDQSGTFLVHHSPQATTGGSSEDENSLFIRETSPTRAPEEATPREPGNSVVQKLIAAVSHLSERDASLLLKSINDVNVKYNGGFQEQQEPPADQQPRAQQSEVQQPPVEVQVQQGGTQQSEANSKERAQIAQLQDQLKFAQGIIANQEQQILEQRLRSDPSLAATNYAQPGPSHYTGAGQSVSGHQGSQTAPPFNQVDDVFRQYHQSGVRALPPGADFQQPAAGFGFRPPNSLVGPNSFCEDPAARYRAERDKLAAARLKEEKIAAVKNIRELAKARRRAAESGANKMAKAKKRSSGASSIQQIYRPDTNVQAILNHQSATAALQASGVDTSFMHLPTDEFNTAVASLKEDGSSGRIDKRYLKKAKTASSARAAGEFQDFVSSRFYDDWSAADDEEETTDVSHDSGNSSSNLDLTNVWSNQPHQDGSDEFDFNGDGNRNGGKNQKRKHSSEEEFDDSDGEYHPESKKRH